MKAIVATAKTEKEAQDIVTAIYEREAHILWVDVNGTQVTAIYETQAEVDARQEKEWQKTIAQAGVKQPKHRKQPTCKDLNAKAAKLFLPQVEVVRSGANWEIRSNYGEPKTLYSCKTSTGISRKLTAMYWEKQITKLKNEGLIA